MPTGRFEMMTIAEAIALLKTHNRWRRGADIPMPDARQLGIAIDVLLDEIERRKDDLK
jgi:hypothetical protein